MIWFTANSSNGTVAITMGLGTSAVNGTEQTISDESTTPSGVSFSSPASKAAGLPLGNLPAGQWKAVWLKRVVSASATVDDAVTYSVKVEGDSNA